MLKLYKSKPETITRSGVSTNAAIHHLLAHMYSMSREMFMAIHKFSILYNFCVVNNNTDCVSILFLKIIFSGFLQYHGN